MNNQTAIVIDAFSSGNQLAPILSAQNVQTIHVFSMEEASQALMATYNKNDFAKEYTYLGDVDALMEQIHSDYPTIQAVFVGTETAIILADIIASKLKLPGNNPLSSTTRINKYEMIETLRIAQVPVTEQIKTENIDEIIAWQKDNRFSKIVVKPLESAGSDCVFACNEKEEVCHAFEEIMGQKNQMGGLNSYVLAQDYLDGEEYYVNAVSCRGEHFICEIWRYHKRSLNGRDFVYDYNEYVSLDESDTVSQLCQYMYRVLDALHFSYGPSHAEIKMTSNGLRLVEIGARLQGMAAFGVNSKTMGFTPAELAVDSYLFPDSFLSKTKNAKHKNIFARRVFLTSYVSGKLKHIHYSSEIENLESCIYLRWIKSLGDKLKPTVDYFSIPAIVVLAHEKIEQIEQDYKFIREFEKSLFETESESE